MKKFSVSDLEVLLTNLNGKTYLVIQNYFVILSNYCRTQDENFLICGLRSGDVQFVHLPSKCPLPPIYSNTEKYVGIQVNANSFSLLTSNGKVIQHTVEITEILSHIF